MSNLKKTAVAVLVALGSTAVSAGTMGPVCTAGNVTVPCETVGWDLGIAGLYLNPVYNAGFGYASVSEVGNDATFNEFNRQWQWGFKLEGSYHWGFGSDINVNWYHLTNGNNHNEYIGLISPQVNAPLGSTYKRDSFWDAVNVEWGQHITASCHKSYRIHGGVQFAKIKTQDDLFVAGALDIPTESDNYRSTYDGFGPRWGINGNYQFGQNGFAVGFDAAAAILVGQSKFNNELQVNTVRATEHGSKTALVPELELSLNANYHWVCANHDASLELGYMWFNYFNAQHNITDKFNAETDFGAQGPYLRAKYVAAT